ncbi:hypothetical protein XELAEV_18002667mg [Xenopus laevis]|uniref:Uncharacterized protein n=1 Tax=Xenopus laevis TaxID=8355 RepID=A0A974BNV4_XENLA|nr:hypothetical protein XELAEV_18002667mg [Xenopus laevis]
MNDVIQDGEYLDAERECLQQGNVSGKYVGNSVGGYLKDEVNLKPCPMYESVCKTECTHCFGPGHKADNCPFKKCDAARVKLREAFDLNFKSKNVVLCEKSDTGGDSQTTISEPFETEGCVKQMLCSECCVLNGNQTECIVENNMVANDGKPHGVSVEESEDGIKLPLKAPDCEVLDTSDPV